MNGHDFVNIVYNVPHDIPLKWQIATYFFLTGISAASFLISTLAYVFGMQKFKPAGRIGAIMAPIVLIIAPIFLIIDLEQPLRFVNLLYMFNFRSPVTWGTFLLILYPLNCLIYLYHIIKSEGPPLPVLGLAPARRPQLRPVAGGSQFASAEAVPYPIDAQAKKLMKIFGSLGIPLAIMVHGYTGFIIGLGQGRAMWNVALMPMYFLVSAMVSGAALLILACIVKEKAFGSNATVTKFFPKITNEVIYSLSKIAIGFITLDMLFVLSEMLVLSSSRPDDYAAALLLLQGNFAPLFLGVQVGLGLIVPLIILSLPKVNKSFAAISAACVLTLIGVYAMRIVTVVGGQMIPLN